MQRFIVAPANGIGGGAKDVTTAGTAVQLTTTKTPITRVIIRAKTANTNNIFYGGSDVNEDLTNGAWLDAGEEAILDIEDLSLIWIDADTNGEGVTYTYLTQAP